MSRSEGRCVRSGRPTLPPLSSRTLHHPSFLPLYVAAGFTHHADCSNQTVHPITPAEFFYTDPAVSCGRRTPNIVTELRVFDCFQLNTPPPLMSACRAPPTRPDPFRSAPHPTRDLGSLTLKRNTLHPGVHPPVQPSRVILQLTQEEDQAVTNLLKLHHQEPVRGDGTLMDLNPIPFFSHPEPMDSTSVEEVCEPFCSDVQLQREASLRGQLLQGRCWSGTELEAASTLLSRFTRMEKDRIRGQNHDKSAATLPEPLPPYQHQEPETLPALITTDCTQNDIGYISFSRVREYGESGSGDFGFDSKGKRGSGVPGGLSEVKERVLSDSEGDAVHVLLSLGDMGALDIVQ